VKHQTNKKKLTHIINSNHNAEQRNAKDLKLIQANFYTNSKLSSVPASVVRTKYSLLLQFNSYAMQCTHLLEMPVKLSKLFIALESNLFIHLFAQTREKQTGAHEQ